MLYLRQGGISAPAVFVSPNKPHNKAIYGTLATAGISRPKPYIPVPAVLLLTFSDCHKPHNKAICSTSATVRISRPKPYIPVPAVLLRTFSDCHKPHNKAVYDTPSTVRKPRPKPYIPVPAVYLRTFSDYHKPHNKAKCGIFPYKCKDGRHEKSCLPFIVSIVYPIKPHCKAK